METIFMHASNQCHIAGFKLKLYGYLLLTAAVALFTALQASAAEQVTGTLGSPSATSTVSNKQHH